MNPLLHLFCCAVILSSGPAGPSPKAVSHTVKKAVKELKSDGWKAISGQMTIDDQISEQFSRQLIEENGMPRFIMCTSTASADDFVTARKLAMTMAKSDIASQFESEISSICDAVLETSTLSDNESKLINSVVDAARVSVTRDLTSIDTVVELFRVSPSNGFEVRITLAYDTEELKSELKHIQSLSE